MYITEMQIIIARIAVLRWEVKRKMNTKEIFSKRLFQLRESKGLSRQAVADDLDITRASLEYYEKGMRTPNLETIFKISEYYQVSIDYLFGKIDNASKNVNTALISDYLGLSEDSIFALHELSEKDKKIINFFIQSCTSLLST